MKRNNYKGSPHISLFIDRCLQPIYFKKGVEIKKIIYDWEEIIGTDIGTETVPYKITRNSFKQQPTYTIHIFVNNPSISTQLYYMTQIILEKITNYVGSNYITQIKYEINHKVGKKQESDAILDLSKIPEPTIKGIDDNDLLTSLQRFGKYIHAAKDQHLR